MATGIQLLERTLISSAEAALMAVVLLLLMKGYRRKLSAGWRYSLWMLLLAKLLLPWLPGDIESSLNWLRLPDRMVEQMTPLNQDKPISVQNNAEPVTEPMTEPNHVSTEIPASNSSTKLLQFSFWVWIAGVLTVMVVMARGSISTFAALRKESDTPLPAPLHTLFHRIRDQMGVSRTLTCRLSDAASAPTLYGFFRPTVLIPRNLQGQLDESDWTCIFRHELTHLKRRDIGINSIFTLIAAIHWFNPVVWYSLHRMRMDQEEACDASVLSRLGNKEAYAACIVKVLEIGVSRQRASAGVGFAGYKKQLARRMVMIRDYKPTRSRISIIGLAILVLTALILLPTAFGATEEKQNTVQVPVADKEKQMIPVQYPAADSASSKQPMFIMPVEGTLTSQFGYRIHPISGEKKLNDGIDIANEKGTPVFASSEGEVTTAETISKKGMTVVIKHNETWQTEYRHLSEIKVEAGQLVKSGELIGSMGSTGDSTGPHLHFSILKDGGYLNPLPLIKDLQP